LLHKIVLFIVTWASSKLYHDHSDDDDDDTEETSMHSFTCSDLVSLSFLWNQV